MESTVITPTEGAAVVAVGENHRGWDHGHRGHSDEFAKVALREDLANYRSLVERIANTKDMVVEGNKDTLRVGEQLGQISAQGFKEGALAAKDGLVTAYQIEGRAAVLATKNAGDVATQNEKIAAANILATTVGFKDALIDSTKNAAAVALQNATNQAATMAAIADCCCETQKLITADGNATRALINSNLIADLQARLASIPRGIAVTLPVIA